MIPTIPRRKPIAVAIVGSRSFRDYPRLCREMDQLRRNLGPISIVSGGAPGADRLAERYAKERGLPIKVFPADWDRYGKKSGFMRNREIVEAVSLVIAYWDGNSKGTAHTISVAKELGKPVTILEFTS